MKRTLQIILPALLLSACGSWHMRTADVAFDRMGYAKAAEHYDKAFASIKDPQERARYSAQMLRAAQACQNQNDHKKAAQWFAEASSFAPLDAEANFHYGQALMGLDRHEEAETYFANVLAEEPEHGAAQDLLFSSRGYDTFYDDSTRFAVTELPIPGIASAFSAVPYKDGLVFVGEQEAGMGGNNPWNGMSFLDLYYAEKHTLVNWENKGVLPGQVNDRYHEGPCAFTADGNTMYFTRSNYYKLKLQKDEADVSHLKMFRAELVNGSWTNIREFPYNSETYSVGHPALSTDGKILYFASDMPGGLGSSDIWYSVNNGTGWEAPKNMGATVNTAGTELFPTVVGNSLYFASSAHTNMGGLDIFETHPENEGWSAPSNMGFPINTAHDDFAFVMNPDGKSGYLSSDRLGKDRIHMFFMNEPIIHFAGLVVEDSLRLYLPHTQVMLSNLITDIDTTYITGPDGQFKFNLTPNTAYLLSVRKDGMLTQSRDIVTTGITTSRTLKEVFRMQEARVDKTFKLQNIYFDLGKWDIRPDAAIELDKLVRFIKENPGLVFELSSHTDSRGADNFNLILSDARANSSVDYLIRHGVPPDRIVARGYGETALVNDCSNGRQCTEEQHQANRRTEVKIIRKDVVSAGP